MRFTQHSQPTKAGIGELPHSNNQIMPGNLRESWGSELKKTLLLAVPITAGHVSNMILGLTDTLMIGRVGVLSLAGAEKILGASIDPAAHADMVEKLAAEL